jgi:phage gp36-like protein
MSYSTRTNIEDIFGVDNVATWGDMDNDQDATKITNRIARGIAVADAMIDAVLDNTDYTVPLTAQPGKSLALITDIAATLAGCWLYEARGLDDRDDEGRPYNRYSANRKRAESMLQRIAEGGLMINAVKATDGVNIPFVV